MPLPYLLKALTEIPSHQFWEDSLALLDGAVFQAGYVLEHRQISDAYLYSLAIQREGLETVTIKPIQTYPI